MAMGTGASGKCDVRSVGVACSKAGGPMLLSFRLQKLEGVESLWGAIR